MIKQLSFIILLFSTGIFYGQTIYIKPIWGSKLNFVKKNPANKIQASPYYKFEESTYQDHFDPDDIGLLIGFKFKKFPLAIETGRFRTDTWNGYKFYHQENVFNSKFISVGSSSGGMQILTYPLQVRFWPNRKFYQNLIEKRFQMSFILGLSYLPGYSSPAEFGTGSSAHLNDSDIINEELYTTTSPRSKHLLDNLMISGGITLTALTKKKREILTLNLQCYYFRHEQSYDIISIWINNDTPVRYYTRSTGSGIGLLISRNINCIRWK